MLDVDAFAALIPVLALGVMAMAVVVAVYTWRKKAQRREALALWGAKRGLAFSAEDPHRTLSLPFRLFRCGDGRGVENVLSGTWEGLPIRLADYWYYDESHDSQGRSSRSYEHYSIALMPIEATLPPVRIEHENAFTRLVSAVGLKDVEFESGEFNRRFRVNAEDREFAFKLLDARMMEWLLATASGHCYEVSGSWVLAYCGQAQPPTLATLAKALQGFVQQVPRLVWADYGKAAQ